MGKYIHYFETETEFNEERTNNYSEPWVSYTEASERVDYNKPDYTKIPFTVESLGSGSITWNLGDKTVQYSKNGGSWETMNSATTISVIEGDEVQFKGTNTDYSNNTISSTAQFNLKGNIMSITNGDDFESADVTTTTMFYELFKNCTSLISANELQLPATTAGTGCYTMMFDNCSNLTKAPELHATTLMEYCYAGMFNGCTSLTAAPALPATTLVEHCYNSMFSGCTSLTVAPVLPATTLANFCYMSMFDGCTSLTTAPELPATTLAGGCYNAMFNGCTNLTTAPALPASTLTASCYYSMFCGCTSLTTAPELPATTLGGHCYSCYSRMFYGCTNLSYIKAMFTTAPGTNYTGNWVSGVAANGTFVKNSAATWTTTGANGVPTGWTVETASS